MRADVLAVACELVRLYRKKFSLIEQLRGNTAALRSFMLSDDLDSFDDICAKDEAIVIEADGIDTEIARQKDELARITGLKPDDAFKRAILPAPEGKAITHIQKSIDAVLSATLKDREEITRTLESRSESHRRSADELEAMAKLREYTPTKEPLL